MKPYNLIRDTETANLVLDNLDPNVPLFVDTETCRERGKTDLKKEPGGLYGKVRLVQLYQKGWTKAILLDCYYVDLYNILAKIKHLTHVGYNYSYDLHTFNCHTSGTYLPTEVIDCFYLAKAKYPEGEKFTFYDALKYAGLEDNAIRAIDKKANQKARWDKPLTEDMKLYAAYDVLYLSMLYEKVKDAMDEPAKLDHDTLRAAIEFDRVGIPISRPAISILRTEQMTRLEEHMQHIPVNINSPLQCKKWLGSTATDAYTLGTMALDGDERAEHLVNARNADKLLLFIEKYDNDVVRGFHNACGARTGRMTCDGGDRFFYENNQNPPRALYPVFQAKEGEVIVYNDYSGLELRTATAYIGENTMYNLFVKGVDLHTYTASQLFGIAMANVTYQQRQVAKVFNFACIYGAGAGQLQNQLQAEGRIHIEIGEVVKLRNRWFKIYEVYNEWHELNKKMFRVYGYVDVETMLGREMRTFKPNDSFNFPVQGSAAEVTKRAVVNIAERYTIKAANISNVVHDSISMVHPENQADLWVDRLNECMVDAWKYVIKDSAYPDLEMPADAQYSRHYPGCSEKLPELRERGLIQW